MGARKPVLPVIAVCCVLVGWLVWACVPAFAAAPETPEVSVGAPVPPTTAMVDGVLNPGVEGVPGTYELGTYEFLYKQGSAGCEGESKAPVSPGISLGGGKEGVSETLSGLSPGTQYTVCLLVRDGIKGEQAVSAPVTFTTSPSLEAPVTTEPASAVSATSATFEGELSPGGTVGLLSYQFDYNTNGTCAGGQSTPAVEVAEAKQLHVSAIAQELEPNGTYTFCLVATNILGEQAQGNEVSLQTGRQAPAITGASVTNIASTAVTVSAQVYPYGETAAYYVEYGPSNTYGSSTPQVNISSQHGPAPIQAQLNGLTTDSEYHYRVIATNQMGTERTPDATFTTPPVIALAGLGLPDNRAYEMVTPPNNQDANVYVPEGPHRAVLSEGIKTQKLFKSSVDGTAVTYLADATTGGFGAGGNGLGSQYLARRSPLGGWVQESIQPPGFKNAFFQDFSGDLSTGIIESGTSYEPELPPLSAGAPGDGYKVLYERENSTGVYRPFFTKIPLNRSPEETGEEFGAFGVEENTAGVQRPLVFAGGSAEHGGLFFEANDSLLIGGGQLEKELEGDVKKEIINKEKHNYLYRTAGDSASLVDVSPEGHVVPNATFGTIPSTIIPDFSHVVSEDGSRVYWTDLSSGVVYVREDGSETVQVSAGSARYWTASVDGRHALYTEGEGEHSELYRFDADAPVGSPEQREALVSANAGVLGVLGASEGGETVYFAAEGVLSAEDSGEGAVPVGGQPNLYVSRRGEAPVFIGTLSGHDEGGVEPFKTNEGNNGGFGDWQPGLAHRTARVTADGGSLVFMSNSPLSAVGYPHGYPNNGKDEVYVYQASTDRLVCASCGSTAGGASAYLPISWSNTYLPQWVSEDGTRVFFDSEAALVPQDTNGKQDVYEWEREGAGSCAYGSGVNGGCVFLLSGGTSESASWLTGESASGDDVFIATRAQLAPEDGNDTFDLYDARVDGVKPISPPECTGTGCQGVPAPPPTFATPPSVTFNGVGNFSALSGSVVKAKAKTLTRAQKLADALKACRKEPKRKRVSCQAHARKRYGVVKKVRKASRLAKGRG